MSSPRLDWYSPYTAPFETVAAALAVLHGMERPSESSGPMMQSVTAMARAPRLAHPALLGALLLSACATVPPGYGAVVTSAFGHMKPLEEGVSWAGIGAQVDVIDLRQQEVNEDLRGVAADGAQVHANASVVTWHVIPQELVAFDREVGPLPYDRLIRPVVQAAVRRVVAGYSSFALMDTRNVPEIQARVLAIGREPLRRMHVQLDAVFMRSLTAISQPLEREIEATSTEEQVALTAPQLLELARQHADERRERGGAIARAHELVAPTLTPSTLEDARRRAWDALLTSPSTHVIAAETPAVLEIAP